MNMKIDAGAVGGKFRMVAIKPDGTERVLADWFDNLITNLGMDAMASGNAVMPIAMLGSSDTAPAFTDTALISLVAASGSATSEGQGNSTSAPYFGWYRRTYRFNAGTATGTLREVGVGWSSGSGGLFSRALIKDSGGNPTSVVVLADEVVDVTYELRLYAPSADSTFDIDISGTTHSCVLRPAGVTGNSWTPLRQGGVPANNVARAHSGDIAAVSDLPSGTSSTIGFTGSGYTSGSFQIERQLTAALTQGNFAGGIKSVSLVTSWLGSFQCSFTPTIMKDGNKILTLDITLAWARHAG